MDDADRKATELVFQQLFEQEFTYVWNALRRLGIGETDREDLVQEVFVRVHKALPTYDATRPPRPWLFAFAFRVASDFRRLKRNQVEIPRPAEVDIPSTGPAPDEALDDFQRRARLHRALDTLDLDKRAVIVLHEMEGLPIPEVAQVLGIPVGTASSRLRAARAKLMEVLRTVMTAGRYTDGRLRREEQIMTVHEPKDVDLDQLFEAERKFEDLPREEVRARVRQGLFVKLGTPTDPRGGTSNGGTPGGGPPSAIGGRTMRLSHAVLGMIGTFIVGAVASRATTATPIPTSTVASATSSTTHRASPSIETTAFPVRELPSMPSPPAPSITLSAMRSPAPPAPVASEAVAAERALLDSARVALANGEPSQVLALTERHEKEFPRGRLVEEREALMIRALVKLGRRDEARERGARFKTTWPRSLAMPAVTAALESIQ